MAAFEYVTPKEIERKSFSIIAQELEDLHVTLPVEQRDIIMRVIHTTADFDYAQTLRFSEDVVATATQAVQDGADIVTDTSMVCAGINKEVLARFGGAARCFIADEDVREEAARRGVTRSMVCMEKAAHIQKPLILAIGNAPTALCAVCDLWEQGFRPRLVIGVPVGFVNVVPSKERLMSCGIPFIVNTGRKGGSTVAAAICNALLYKVDRASC